MSSVSDLLDNLASAPGGPAAELARLGFRGCPRSGTRCVLANYLTSHDVSVSYVDGVFVRAAEPGQREYDTYALPPSLVSLVRAFDVGALPELIG